MASPLDMLGELIQAGMTKSSNNRVKNAMGGQSSGSLGGILEDFSKQLETSTGSSGSFLDQLSKMAQETLKDPVAATKGGNPVAIGGLGALAGAVLGNPGGAAKGALGAGAMALLAMLAKNALSGKDAGPSRHALADLPLGLREPASPSEAKELHARADLVMAAMINAAKADGVIDQNELNRIVGRLEETGADRDEAAYVQAELRKPGNLLDLIKAVPNQEAAVQVYAASLLATEADTPVERDYLNRLAQGLDLPQQTVAYVHRSLGVA